ncbi:MAG: hypothetical protein A07HR67_01823 [uncultured archaeon A07HR67]|nr:MAG: hypothetical protein A07HR67_01823 [uncultured archaeon A07HR67]
MSGDNLGEPLVPTRLRAVVDSVREPEHLGENRCLQCALVNAVGVGVAALLLARHRRSLGLLVAVVGAAAIWLRGYVVPGTPRFAPRLVEPLPVDICPNHPDDLGSGSLAGPRPDSHGCGRSPCFPRSRHDWNASPTLWTAARLPCVWMSSRQSFSCNSDRS